jgi:hypothetical protein
MAVTQRTKMILNEALCDATAAAELVAGLEVGETQQSAIAAVTVTATTNAASLPPVVGTVTIADGSSATNVELLHFCEELNAQINTIRAALKGYGVTS